jgi:hypothetical protein
MLQNLTKLDPSSPPFARLGKEIGPIVNVPSFPQTAPVFLEWLPKVSRFSFEVGRAVQLRDPQAVE